MHRRVRDQSILVGEILTANLTREFRDSVTSPFVPLHVGHVHTHEAALGARHSLRCVRLLHVGVKHKLLRVILVAGDALEGPMDAVRYSQVRDQSGDEVEFRLAQLADLLATFESATVQNSKRFRDGSFPFVQTETGSTTYLLLV